MWVIQNILAQLQIQLMMREDEGWSPSMKAPFMNTRGWSETIRPAIKFNYYFGVAAKAGTEFTI
jgi:hypothetical protein